MNLRQRIAALPAVLSYIGMISSGEALELFHDAKSIAVPARLVRNPESSYVIKAKDLAFRKS